MVSATHSDLELKLSSLCRLSFCGVLGAAFYMFIGTNWWWLIILRNVKSFIISWFWVENFWPNVENFLVVLSKLHSWCPWEHFSTFWKTCVFHITLGRSTRKNSALCRKILVGVAKTVFHVSQKHFEGKCFPAKNYESF